MKYIAVLLVLVLFVSSGALASSISAIGYAQDPMSAQERALEKLSERIFGSYVSTVTSVNTADGTNGSYSSNYSNTYSNITRGRLIGVQYSNANRLSDGSYEVMARIEDSESLRYSSAIKRLSDSISNDYKWIDSGNLEQRKSRLVSLIENVQLFHDYSQVLFLLKGSEDIPQLPIEETEKSLRDRLESLLIEEMNGLSAAKLNSNEENRRRIEAQLDRLKSEQEELIETAKNAEMEERRKYEQSIRDRIERLVSKSLGYTVSSVGGYSIADDVAVAGKSVGQYNSIIDQYEAQLTELREKNAREVEIGTASIMDKKYSLAWLDKNGKPTPLAMSLREKQVSEFQKQKSDELSAQISLADSLFRPEIQRIYDNMVATCLNLEDRSYGISTAGHGLSFDNIVYDSSASNFIVQVKSPYIGKFSFSLPYSLVTGKAPVTSISASSYEIEEFETNVSTYIEKFDSIFSLSTSITVTLDAVNGYIRSDCHDLRLYKGETLVKVIPSEKGANMEKISTMINSNSYSWLREDPRFNRKAGTEDFYSDIVIYEQEKAAEEREEIHRLKVKSNSDYYTIGRRLVLIPQVLLHFGVHVDLDSEESSTSTSTASNTNTETTSLVGAGLALEFDYVIKRGLSISAMPFFNIGNIHTTKKKNTVTSSSSEWDTLSSKDFNSVGALVGCNWRFYNPSSGGNSVGTKVGYSTETGALFCIDTKWIVPGSRFNMPDKVVPVGSMYFLLCTEGYFLIGVSAGLAF